MTSQYRYSRPALMVLLLIPAMFLVAGCGQSRGFALPGGDVDAGQVAFSKFNCNACHSIGDLEFKGPAGNVHIPLGGEVSALKSYGELVTSVINPSHKIDDTFQQATQADGTSKMKVYNEVMTVQELIDLVSFLQSNYEIKTPSEFYYPY